MKNVNQIPKTANEWTSCIYDSKNDQNLSENVLRAHKLNRPVFSEVDLTGYVKPSAIADSDKLKGFHPWYIPDLKPWEKSYMQFQYMQLNNFHKFCYEPLVNNHNAQTLAFQPQDFYFFHLLLRFGISKSQVKNWCSQNVITYLHCDLMCDDQPYYFRKWFGYQHYQHANNYAIFNDLFNSIKAWKVIKTNDGNYLVSNDHLLPVLFLNLDTGYCCDDYHDLQFNIEKQCLIQFKASMLKHQMKDDFNWSLLKQDSDVIAYKLSDEKQAEKLAKKYHDLDWNNWRYSMKTINQIEGDVYLEDVIKQNKRLLKQQHSNQILFDDTLYFEYLTCMNQATLNYVDDDHSTEFFNREYYDIALDMYYDAWMKYYNVLMNGFHKQVLMLSNLKSLNDWNSIEHILNEFKTQSTLVLQQLKPLNPNLVLNGIDLTPYYHLNFPVKNPANHLIIKDIKK